MSQLGILLISHGDFAQAALSSAELIVGKQNGCQTMGVYEVDNISKLHEELKKMVKEVKTEKGVVILTDMLGGTPMNLSLSLLEEKDILVSSGLNMPVLLEVLMNRHLTLDEMKKKIKEAYKHGLHIKTHEDFIEEDDEVDML